MNRTRVPRWNPPLLQALRLAARPAIAYLVFCVGGFAAFFGSIVWYEGMRDVVSIVLAIMAGIAGILAGMLIAVLRAKTAGGSRNFHSGFKERVKDETRT